MEPFEDDSFYDFPAYQPPFFLLIDATGRLPHGIQFGDDAKPALSVFTNDLDAERARDADFPNGDIRRFDTWDDFGEVLMDCVDRGIHHVSIDTPATGRKCAVVPINVSRLRERFRGN